MLRQLIAISCVSVATAAAAAEPVALKGSAIKETVAGAMVELDTPAGTKIPVRFGTDGLMSGEAGDLASFLGAPKDRGRWWAENDQLCTKWFRWFDAEKHCVHLEQDGKRIFWREDNGEKGTATITVPATQVADKSVKPSVEAGRMPIVKTPAATAPVDVAENVPAATLSDTPGRYAAERRDHRGSGRGAAPQRWPRRRRSCRVRIRSVAETSRRKRPS